MRSFRPSPAAVLAFIALLVALGGTALAATGQLVNIGDPSNPARVARVDAVGRLDVGDGSGPLTVDGNVRESAPATWWRSYGWSHGEPEGQCVALYSPPSGKAAVVKTLVTNVISLNGTPGTATFTGYFVSPYGCAGTYAYDVNPTASGVTTMPLDPGLVIPAGSTLWMQSIDVNAEGEPSGYTLPASAVPSTPAVRASRSAQRAR